jgi:hypothetical protein
MGTHQPSTARSSVTNAGGCGANCSRDVSQKLSAHSAQQVQWGSAIMSASRDRVECRERLKATDAASAPPVRALQHCRCAEVHACVWCCAIAAQATMLLAATCALKHAQSIFHVMRLPVCLRTACNCAPQMRRR